MDESIDGIIKQFNGKLFYSKLSLYEYMAKNKCDDAFICAYMLLSKYNEKCIRFARFKNIDHFECVFFNIKSHMRTFFHVLTSPSRRFYADIDFISNDVKLLKISKEIGMKILQKIKYIFCTQKGLKYHKQEINNSKIDWILYDSSRYKSNKEVKLSFHIFNNNILYKNLEDLRHDINFITEFDGNDDFNSHDIVNHNVVDILKTPNSFDQSVYNCADYQLLRMSGCIKLDDLKSVKKLIFPSNLTFKEELKINQCDYVLPKNDTISKYKNSINSLNNEESMILIVRKKNISENCVCVNSNNGLFIYNFASKINNLEWEEKRCMKCGSIKVIYSNSSIEYPRQYCNLPLNDNKEIEKINFAINKFKIQIKNEKNYGFIFKANGFKKDLDKKKIKYMITFTKDVIATCGHNPNTFYVKSFDNKFINIDGRFSYYCSHCQKFFNINN